MKCLVKSRAVEGLLLVLAKAFLYIWDPQALFFESLRSFKGLDVRAIGLVHGLKALVQLTVDMMGRQEALRGCGWSLLSLRSGLKGILAREGK